MRRPTTNSLQFIIGDPSSITNVADLVRYVQEMESRYAAALAIAASGHKDVIYVFPDKPQQGDVEYFDGVMANPGGGEGWYYYNSAGQWIQLG